MSLADVDEDLGWVAMFVFLAVTNMLAVNACATQPTRVKVQEAADHALDKERDEARRREQCDLLTRAARIARMQHSSFAGLLAADAFRVCHPGSSPEVWP